MILTYKNYVLTGTAQELKEFIDLIENKSSVSSNLQGLTLEDRIPHGTVPVFDPNTGGFVEGRIKEVKTKNVSYPNNACENH